MRDRRIRFAFSLGQALLILTGVLIIYLVVDFGRQMAVLLQRRDELNRTSLQVTAAQAENAALQSQLDYSKSPEAAELWAREHGMAKANEVPVVILGPTPGTPVPGTKSSQPARDSSASSAQDWWDLFFAGK